MLMSVFVHVFVLVSSFFMVVLVGMFVFVLVASFHLSLLYKVVLGAAEIRAVFENGLHFEAVPICGLYLTIFHLNQLVHRHFNEVPIV